jgi:transposase
MLEFSINNRGLEKRMLGRKDRSEKMFYYVKIDDLIPEDHLLRLIHRYVDLGFIRKKVAHLYSHTGRPSIDPEVLLRMLLIGYFYGITSERRLCEEVKMHLGYRWFVGLDLEDTIPDHSTFSHNRHDRFCESTLFQEIFDEIITQCMRHGLVKGTHLTVDATHIKADASFKSFEPVVVEMKPRQYIDTLQKENPVDDKPWEPGDDYPHRGEKISNSTHRSKTDPDARLSRKAPGSGAQLAHSATYVIDNGTSIIVGAGISRPDLASEGTTALTQILRSQWRFKLRTRTVGADKGYSTGEFIHALTQQRIDPHVPVIDHRSQNDKGIYPLSAFTFDKEHNRFVCPEGKELSYWGVHTRQHVYRARTRDCRTCSRKDACTRDRSRSLSYHIYETSIEKARSLNATSHYRISQRMRKRIEELFGEAKELMGFRRAKFRYRRFVAEQVLMTAAAQNIKRMVKLLSRRAPITEAGVDRAPLLYIRESLESVALMVARRLRTGRGFPEVTVGWN